MANEPMDAQLAAELSQETANRKNVYALLARCFEKEVDAAFAADVAESFAFESEDAVLNESVAALRACLAGVDAAGIEQLAVWFDRIFFGMGPLSAKHAFPYESVYTSQRGLLMQEAYGTTRRAYRENGLQKSDDFAEPDDHLAVQLAFMAALCDRAAEALEARDEDAAEAAFKVQRQFARGHLLNWIGRFAADVETAASAGDTPESGFYAHAARFTARFVELDVATLDDMLG